MNATAIWFADTSFWVTVSQKTDQYHGRASAWLARSFGLATVLWCGQAGAIRLRLVKRNAFILTTEAVLREWMKALANSPTPRATGERYRRCHQDAQIEVVAFAVDMTDDASRLYDARSDKD